MPNVIETRDPRGWQVICTQEQWSRHVLAACPWMAGWEELVRAAIERPNIGIYRDAHRDDRHIYYRLIQRRGRYLKVVVQVLGEQGAEVITAFTTDSPKSGETLLWPESSD